MVLALVLALLLLLELLLVMLSPWAPSMGAKASSSDLSRVVQMVVRDRGGRAEEETTRLVPGAAVTAVEVTLGLEMGMEGAGEGGLPVALVAVVVPGPADEWTREEQPPSSHESIPCA